MTVEPLETLHERGAHLVRLRGGDGGAAKLPAEKAWQLPENAMTRDALDREIARGAPVGVIPKSLMIAVADVDLNEEHADRLGEAVAFAVALFGGAPRVIVPSAKPYRRHVLFRIAAPADAPSKRVIKGDFGQVEVIFGPGHQTVCRDPARWVEALAFDPIEQPERVVRRLAVASEYNWSGASDRGERVFTTMRKAPRYMTPMLDALWDLCGIDPGELRRSGDGGSVDSLDPEGPISLARFYAKTITLAYRPGVDDRPGRFYAFDFAPDKPGWWPVDRAEVRADFLKRFVWGLFVDGKIDAAARRRIERSAFYNDVLRHLEAEPVVRRDAGLFDADGDVVGLPDGRTLHVPSATVLPKTSAHLVTRSLRVVPDFDTRPSAFLAWAAEAWEPEVLDFMLAYARLGLTADTSRHLALYCWGLPGSGKSTFFEILRRLYGMHDDPAAAPDGTPQRPGYCGVIGGSAILDSKFEQHPTWKECTRVARFVTVDDVPDKPIAEATLNTLIAGGADQSRGMRQDASTLTAVSKFYMTGNAPLRAAAGGGLLGRRLAVLEMRATPDVADPGLWERLARDEGPAILGLILRADMAVLDPSNWPASIREATDEARGEVDRFRELIAAVGWQEGTPCDRVSASAFVDALKAAGRPEADYGARWLCGEARKSGFEVRRVRERGSANKASFVYGVASSSLPF